MKIFTHSIGEINYTIRVGQNAKENWDLIDKVKEDKNVLSKLITK